MKGSVDERFFEALPRRVSWPPGIDEAAPRYPHPAVGRAGAPQALPGMREALENPSTHRFISAASAWEIGTQWRLGKLPGARSVVERYQRVMDGLGASECPILSEESLQAGTWGVAQRDPFDRMLAAQALCRNLTLATTDPIFSSFEGVRTFSS